MSERERALLLKINEQVKRLTQPPPTTFAPQTGTIKPETQYQPSTLPPIIPISPKYKG